MIKEARMSNSMTTRPLHISFVIYTLETFGGAERATTLVANALAGRGHRVTIVTLWGRESRFPLHPGVHLHALQPTAGSFKRRYLADVLGLRAYFRGHTPDVVVGSETSVMLLVLPATAGLGVVRVGWEHFNFNTIFNRPKGRLNRWRLARTLTARFAQAVVVLTRRDAELWRMGIPGIHARLEVIPNFLPFPRPAVNPYRPDRKVVLSAGRLSGEKGFDLLLEAWGRVEQDFPEWALRIVGDGEEASRLKAQALHAGLQRVEFAGRSGDMPAHYAAAGLYCLSSRSEGFGMVLIESQAYGLPAVAFDCEVGPRELVEHGVNGLLVASGDTAALAEGLRTAMSSPELRARMSGRSYEAAARFKPQEIIAQWEELLGSLRREEPRREQPMHPAFHQGDD